MNSTQEISSIFAEKQYMVQPSTIEYITTQSDTPLDFAKNIVNHLPDDVSTVTPTDIEELDLSEDTSGDESVETTTERTQSKSEDSEPDSTEGSSESTDTSETGAEAHSDEKSKSTEDESEDEDNDETNDENSDEDDDDGPLSVNPNPTDESAEKMVADTMSDRAYRDFDESVELEDIGVFESSVGVAERDGSATVEVVKDITGNSTGTGSYKEYAQLFNDRFEKLENILQKRVSPIPIKACEKSGGKSVTLLGRVTDVRTTKKGNRLVVIEDRTGESPVVFTDEKEMDLTEEVLEGEVVALEGEVSGNGEILFGNAIHFPDVPPRNAPTKADRPVKAAFISDIHLGADTFASDGWNNFVDWIRGAENVEYLFVAGDIVEGIGVYPGQEDILTILDMYRQYEVCGEAFSMIPDDVEIVICSGNHDMIRLAEPQPALPDKFTKSFGDNVTFTGNPSTIKIEDDITIELYHGMSINGFTDSIPEANVDDPTTAMRHMVKKRHLAPLYGYNTRIATEEEDLLVLDGIPDVLHSGHVHTFGVDTYNGVTIMNTGAWQYQTDFQEKMNIVPTVANAAVMNLQNFNVEIRDFLNDTTE